MSAGRVEGQRLFEWLAEQLDDVLPLTVQRARTRDAIELIWGGEDGVVLLLTPEAAEFRLPTIDWTRGSHGPADSSRLWRRTRFAPESTGDDALEQIRDGVRAAWERRRRELIACRFCGEPTPPERRASKACHGCASAHLGIVF